MNFFNFFDFFFTARFPQKKHSCCINVMAYSPHRLCKNSDANFTIMSQNKKCKSYGKDVFIFVLLCGHLLRIFRNLSTGYMLLQHLKQ